MPKITDERREARRQQILDAARACLLEHGLEAASMEMIIARSGLSTGAVYRYFKGKDEIIEATVAASANDIAAAVAPILAGPKSALPSQLVEQLLAAWASYSRAGVGAAAGLDRMPVALHGWSYAQTNPHLKAALQAGLRAFRDACIPFIKQWQADGVIAASADPGAVAQLLLSIFLGFVAQSSLTSDTGVQAHVDALAAITAARLPPGQHANSARPAATDAP
jgi:AcrR family transcriptional regulator